MEDHANNCAAEGSVPLPATPLPEDAPCRIPCAKGVIGASPELFQYGSKTKSEDVPIELLTECVRVSQEVVEKNGGVQRKGEEEDVGTRDLLLHCTVLIRKMLAVEKDAPIDQVIATNIVPLWADRISHFCNLDRERTPAGGATGLRVMSSEFAKIQFEMIWALTNIASGLPRHTNYILSSSATSAVMELLKSSGDDFVLEQATWFLGNVAGDGSQARDYILLLGAAQAFMDIHLRHPHYDEVISLRRNITWALSNLCRGKPSPPVDHIAPIIPVFLQEIHSFYEDTTNGDEDCRTDALWGLSYIIEGGTEEYRKAITQSSLFSWTTFLKILVKEESPSAITPLVRFLGSWATGSDEDCQVFFEHDLISPLARFLASSRRGIRKEVCWLFSSLLAGPASDITYIIDSSSQVFEKLQLICETDTAVEVCTEATWALSNASCRATREDAERLIKKGVLESLVTVVQNRGDFKILAVALESIGKFLESPNPETNPDLLYEAKMRIFDSEGLDHLERCCQHGDAPVEAKARSILEAFFKDFDRSQPQGIDRKWTKGKKSRGCDESDSDHNSDGEGYDL